jgi:hypothetical protein
VWTTFFVSGGVRPKSCSFKFLPRAFIVTALPRGRVSSETTRGSCCSNSFSDLFIYLFVLEIKLAADAYFEGEKGEKEGKKE